MHTCPLDLEVASSRLARAITKRRLYDLGVRNLNLNEDKLAMSLEPYLLNSILLSLVFG
jgi:hypothetical protein